MRTYVLIGHPPTLFEKNAPYADGCFVLREQVEMLRAGTRSGPPWGRVRRRS